MGTTSISPVASNGQVRNIACVVDWEMGAILVCQMGYAVAVGIGAKVVPIRHGKILGVCSCFRKEKVRIRSELCEHGSLRLTNLPGADGTDYDSNDITVRACDDGSFCPDQSNVTCCKYHDGFVIRNTTSRWNIVVPYNATLSTSTSSQISTPTSSPTSTTAAATTTSAASSDSSGGISSGAIAGAVVGGVVVGALCLAAILLLIRRKRRNRAREAASIVPSSGPDDKRAFLKNGRYEIDGQERLELDNAVVMHELPVTERTQELATTNSIYRANQV